MKSTLEATSPYRERRILDYAEDIKENAEDWEAVASI